VLKISLSMPAIIHYKVKVMFYSKECSWPAQRGQSLLNLAMAVGGKDTDPVKTWIAITTYLCYVPCL
jgi:hypothetical protein